MARSLERRLATLRRRFARGSCPAYDASDTSATAAHARRRDGGAVVIATMLPRKGTVGVQTHVRQSAELLAGAGNAVRVMHPGSGVPVVGSALLLPGHALRRAGLETGVRLDRYWHRLFLQSGLRREVARRPVRLVYAQDPRSAHAAVTARGTTDIPVVMAVHYNESQAKELVERGLIAPGGRAYRAIKEFEAALLPRLDGLVFVSDFMRRLVEAEIPGVSAVPSVVIPNFLGPGEPAPVGQADRDCISVGNLGERKNHQYLLHVLAAARRDGHRYTLTLVGDGAQRDGLQRLATDLGVADQVLFTGTRYDVDHLLRRHRVYVHSSLMENCTFALLEAFRAGLPVVAGAVGGIPEVLGDSGAGRFWDLADPVDGARVLAAVLEDSTALEKAAASARTRFATQFSADVVGRRLVRFLGAVAERSV